MDAAQKKKKKKAPRRKELCNSSVQAWMRNISSNTTMFLVFNILPAVNESKPEEPMTYDPYREAEKT